MRERWRLDLSAVVLYLALGAMFSAAPRFVHESLGGSRALSGFSVSVFFIAAVVTRPVAGRLIDRYGRRPFIAATPFLVSLFIASMVAAESIAAVLALRFVQGVAGSAFYVAAVTASTDIAGPSRRASAVARLSFAIYFGFALGPTAGERLADSGFDSAWVVLAALAAVAGAVALTVPETRPVPSPLLAPAVGAVPVSAGSAGVVPGHRAHPPLVHPAAVLPGITLLTLGVGYVSVTSQSALYARAVGIGSSSALFATYAVTILAVRLVAGRLADRVGPVRIMFPGMAALAAGCALWALVHMPVTAYTGAVFIGTGWALVFPALTAWLSARVPDEERGSAIGSLVAFMDVGQGFGGYLVGAVADGSGFGWAFAVPALLAVVGSGVLTLAVRRHPDELTPGEVEPLEVMP